MDKLELAQAQSFLRGDRKEKEKIFLEYLEKFEDDINFKKKHFKRYLDATEVDSDAIFAIEEMFKEVKAIMDKAERKAEKKFKEIVSGTLGRIKMQTIFNKHLMRFSRENKIENQPLTQVIKLEFGKTVKNPVYDGYKHCLAVFTDEGLKTYDFPGNPEKERLEYVKCVMEEVAKDSGTNIYIDFIEHFSQGETLRAIASKPRNNNVSKQEIHRRLKLYVSKIHKKLNLGDKYGV